MRLADFIDANKEAILTEWEEFARTLLPAAVGLDAGTLRDHAEGILAASARDLRTAQTSEEQLQKSQGKAFQPLHAPETAAETHGLLRATDGFTLKQLIAEYRALRASVLKLWAAAHDPDAHALDDMTRFNEAIDQAVAESVDFFTRETERWRNVFLGVLGHDLRGPLNAILLTTRLLSHTGEGMQLSKLAERLMNGGERMRQLLDDLLDYSRASLNHGIPIAPSRMDLAKVCAEEVELQRAVWPDRVIELVYEGGESEGEWDAARLKQVLGNLISNAAKYGYQDAPIKVRFAGKHDEVTFSVENNGPTISATGMKALFEPFHRESHSDEESERTSLGLGLFIVSHIVRAHGGTVSLTSKNETTVFSVVLPRSPLPSGRHTSLAP